jgi:hypothetical protein
MRRPLRSAIRARTLDAPQQTAESMRSSAIGGPAPSSRTSIQALAWMYLGGATFAVGVIALVQSSHLTDGLMIALILIAYTAGFGLLLGRRLLPDTAVDAALALGIVLNTVAIAHLGEAPSGTSRSCTSGRLSTRPFCSHAAGPRPRSS